MRLIPVPVLPELQHRHGDKGHHHITMPHLWIPHTAILRVAVMMLLCVRMCEWVRLRLSGSEGYDYFFLQASQE